MRRTPLGYKVRRPMTINGIRRFPGEELSQRDIDSLVRIEGVVASGKIVPIWIKPEKPKRKYTKKQTVKEE